MATTDTRDLRDAMVDRLKERGLEFGSELENAFRAIPRDAFLPGVSLERVYSGDAIITKQDDEGRPLSSSSEVGIMAVMARLLALESNQRILEIGAGTGYNAAVLAELVGADGAVTTVEIDPATASEAREHLDRTGYGRVRVVTGDGWDGFAEGAPYDRIEVTASVADLSPRWIEQLASGGRIVIPFVLRAGVQSVVAFRKEATGLASTGVAPGGFMPLRGPMGPRPAVHRVDGWRVEFAEDVPLAADALESLLRERPRLEIAPSIGWEALDLLALLAGNISVQRPPHQGFAVGIFDPTAGGLALVELAGGSVAGPLTLFLSFGSDQVLSRLRLAIDELRRIRLRDLAIIAKPTRHADDLTGDVVVRRENFTFAFTKGAQSS